MTGEGLSGFQAALHALLSNDETLDALGVALYDNVPAGAVFPYIAYGDASATDRSSRTGHFETVSLTCHIYARGGGRAELLAILARLDQLLEGATLTSDEVAITALRFDKATVALDPDGLTWHGIAFLKALVSPLH